MEHKIVRVNRKNDNLQNDDGALVEAFLLIVHNSLTLVPSTDTHAEGLELRIDSLDSFDSTNLKKETQFILLHHLHEHPKGVLYLCFLSTVVVGDIAQKLTSSSKYNSNIPQTKFIPFEGKPLEFEGLKR